MKTNNAVSNYASVDMDRLLAGTMKEMPMKTTKSIFRVLQITLGLKGRICPSSLGPLLLLLLILAVFGAQAAVVLTTLYSFGSIQDTNGVPLDGCSPQAGLVQGSDGNFYGTTPAGGTNMDIYGHTYGTVFKITTNGTLTTLYNFGTIITNASGDVWPLDGGNPMAELVQGSDGYFYGTTSSGGTYTNWGTVFQISTNGVLTTLHSFTGGNDGRSPRAGLVQGSDGSFYGTTAGGGTNGGWWGTMFKISPNGALTTLYSFTGGNDGASPAAALVQGSDGYFYGTTSSGGTNGCGTVFKISSNGALMTLYAFGWITNAYGRPLDGAHPVAKLVQGSDGYFYCTTLDQNAISQDRYGGTVFKISPSGALTTLYTFGENLSAALVQGSDGSFYGTTVGRPDVMGLATFGTVFRLTIVPQPQLTIIPSGPYMILTWPTNYAGFTLQSTTNLGSSAVWTTNSSPPVVIGGENVVINAIIGRQQFYRLSQ
jgi:uncharacterized repeat protein (TIGR03803 family)